MSPHQFGKYLERLRASGRPHIDAEEAHLLKSEKLAMEPLQPDRTATSHRLNDIGPAMNECIIRSNMASTSFTASGSRTLFSRPHPTGGLVYSENPSSLSSYPGRIIPSSQSAATNDLYYDDAFRKSSGEPRERRVHRRNDGEASHRVIPRRTATIQNRLDPPVPLRWGSTASASRKPHSSVGRTKRSRSPCLSYWGSKMKASGIGGMGSQELAKPIISGAYRPSPFDTFIAPEIEVEIDHGLPAPGSPANVLPPAPGSEYLGIYHHTSKFYATRGTEGRPTNRTDCLILLE